MSRPSDTHAVARWERQSPTPDSRLVDWHGLTVDGLIADRVRVPRTATEEQVRSLAATYARVRADRERARPERAIPDVLVTYIRLGQAQQDLAWRLYPWAGGSPQLSEFAA